MHNPFRYFNSSPEVIRLTVMMYIRYPLSLRQVEDLLSERGIDICHESVRFGHGHCLPVDMPQIGHLEMKGYSGTIKAASIKSDRMTYSKLKAPAFGSAIAITLLAMSSASMADAGVRGDFVVIGERTASDVAGPPPTLEDRSGNIGNTISFGPVLVWNDGTECDDWSLEVSDSPVVFQEDPNLSDLQVPPVDAAHSAGDQRENVHYELLCRGETLGAFLKVDDRTLVVPHVSGRTYEILERPLTASQVKIFQTELKSMKFYSHEPTGVLDDSTRSSAAFYAEYRGALYVFKDVAITENLLDALYVLPSARIPEDVKGED